MQSQVKAEKRKKSQVKEICYHSSIVYLNKYVFFSVKYGAKKKKKITLSKTKAG